ncbi:hypothetical protein U1Q18_015543 [Sarracenia purpurea var. burkii]
MAWFFTLIGLLSTISCGAQGSEVALVIAGGFFQWGIVGSTSYRGLLGIETFPESKVNKVSTFLARGMLISTIELLEEGDDGDDELSSVGDPKGVSLEIELELGAKGFVSLMANIASLVSGTTWERGQMTPL